MTCSYMPKIQCQNQSNAGCENAAPQLADDGAKVAGGRYHPLRIHKLCAQRHYPAKALDPVFLKMIARATTKSITYGSSKYTKKKKKKIRTIIILFLLFIVNQYDGTTDCSKLRDQSP